MTTRSSTSVNPRTRKRCMVPPPNNVTSIGTRPKAERQGGAPAGFWPKPDPPAPKRTGRVRSLGLCPNSRANSPPDSAPLLLSPDGKCASSVGKKPECHRYSGGDRRRLADPARAVGCRVRETHHSLGPPLARAQMLVVRFTHPTYLCAGLQVPLGSRQLPSLAARPRRCL